MSALRGTLEHLSRGWSFRRRLQRKYGGCELYVSPECGLRYWLGWGKADEKLLDSAAQTVKPGSVVWDVGANMGLFSFAAAGLAGPKGSVYAFEPDTVLVKLLRRSAALNRNVAPVQVVACAVSDRISLECFNIAERARSASFLNGFGTSQTGGIREKQIVPTMPLDWIAEHLPVPDVLKIDTEGAELCVLRGAIEVLKSKRPIVICEVLDASREAVSSLLLDLGYTLYDGDVELGDRRPLRMAGLNTLALPGATP